VSRWWVRWRLALRIAHRDARRHRGRTALVLAMVGLPVLAVVGIDTIYRTNDVTPVEALPATLGASDARIIPAARGSVYADPINGFVVSTSWQPADPPWTPGEVAAALPEGSRLVATADGQLAYRTDAGYARVNGTAEDLTDPALDGAVALLDGRFPSARGEVAVSRAVADRGIGVGDELALTRDDVPAEVVGVVGSRAGSPDPFLVVAPNDAALLEDARTSYLATVPGGLDWPAVQGLNDLGLVVQSRQVIADPPPEQAWMPPGQYSGDSSSSPEGTAVLALVVASVVIEIVLLAGPAFAVGVRRQRRDLALIAATGGGPGDLRRVVLASGVVLGGGAAVLGALLGVGLSRVAMPLMERWTTVSFGPFDVPVRDVLITAAVGAVAGLAAAYVPARQAARTDVVNTLADRRGQVRTSWRSPIAGLAVAAAGMALVVWGARGAGLGVALGAVVLVVGVVVAAPWLVGLLAPLSRRLPTAGRLAVRDATRNRGRTAPAVAAVMATVAGVTALAIGSQSDSTQARRDYVAQGPLGTALVHAAFDEQEWSEAEALLRDQVPDRSVQRMRTVSWSGGNGELVAQTAGCTADPAECRWFPTGVLTTVQGELIVADAAALRAVDDGSLPDAAFRALDDGRVAVVGHGAVDADGQVTLAETEYDDTGNGTVAGTVRLPATEVEVGGAAVVAVPAVIVVPPSLTDRLPVDVVTAALVIGGPDDPVTPAQEQTMKESLAGLSVSTSVYVERGWTDDLAVARWLLFALGGLLVLVATLTATGLALTDARPDFATLAAVGAAPGTRRLVAMGSAAVISGTGALLGLLVGFAPGIAIAYPLTLQDFTTVSGQVVIDVPWLLLAGVAVLVPLLAVAVTGLAVRSRLPMARRLP
jgi:putative ABC transport system permease protein